MEGWAVNGAENVTGDDKEFVKTHCKELAAATAEETRNALSSILCGPYVMDVMLTFPEAFTAMLPEIALMVNFDQRNKYHEYDVWSHTANVVAGVRPAIVLRMAALLHDTGKPRTFTVDEEGHGHFYGHPVVSAEIANVVLNRLEWNAEEQDLIETLVRYHDARPPHSDKSMRRYVNKIGRSIIPLLLELKMSDTVAHKHIAFKRNFEEFARLHLFLEREDREVVKMTIQKLNITGNDLLLLGVQRGTAMGAILQTLLNEVTEGELQNEKYALQERVSEIINK